MEQSKAKQILKQNLLPASVCITGACVLIIEIVAVRALAPFYGNTIFTYSSVISVILAALSIGYYAGGKFADRLPSLRWFFGMIMASGLSLLIFYFLGLILLPELSTSLSITSGPLISSILLFMFPALLLGTLSPYAVKLQTVQFPEQGVGSTAGKIFFWSTLGSIAGSLSTGFVLIPNMGIEMVFIATSVVLFALGFVPLIFLNVSSKKLLQVFIPFTCLVVISMSIQSRMFGAAVYHKDGVYEKLTIVDGVYKERPARFFYQDRSSSSAMFLDSSDPTDLAYDYTRYYSLYKVFKPDVETALVIGGGTYSIPKALLSELPDATIEVAEIEPSLYELSKTYFGLKEDDRLVTYTEDGRRLLRDSTKEYDLIFNDAYHSLFSVPSHLTTQEFFLLVKERLSEDGVFLGNMIGDLPKGEEDSFLLAEIKTFQSVFPNSYFFATESPTQTEVQNVIFLGINSDKNFDLQSELFTEHPDTTVQNLSIQSIDVESLDLASHPILTDDFSPVEALTAKTLQRTFGK